MLRSTLLLTWCFVLWSAMRRKTRVRQCQATLRRQRNSVMALTVLLCSAGALPAGEPGSLLGTWKIIQFHDDGSDKIGRLGVAPAQGKRVERIAKLVITKDEIYVLRGDGQRDVLAGLTNCAWKSYLLNEKAEPKQIDIVGVPDKQGKPKSYLGIYSLDKDKLTICWNETPRTSDPAKNRPSKLISDGELNLFVCERLASETESKTP